MKKIFSIIALLCLAVTSAWAQKTAGVDCAENSPYATAQKTKVLKAPRKVASVSYGDVVTTINASSGYQYGVCTDGTYIYTSSWSTSITDGYIFHKYDFDGNLVDAFNIEGVTLGVRDMTYDGTYFYGATNSNTVYQMDFANKTKVGSISIPKAVRAITYDSTTDGFWATGNWDGTLDLYDRNGVLIKNGKSCSSVSGCAYCVDIDGEEHVLLLQNSTGDQYVYDYNITTDELSDVTINLRTIPGSTGSSGGCFIGNYNGTVCLFADMQQDPQFICIVALSDALGGEGKYTLSAGVSEHGTLQFFVEDEEVTRANAGDEVTVVVNADKGWQATAVDVAPHTDWGSARAPRRAPAQINITQPFEADATDDAGVFTFVMPESNVDLLVTYDHKSLADAMIAALDEVTYTGSKFTPLPVVTDGDYDLVKDVDYTVSYADNVNAGTATVTITAIGEDERDYFYTGTASKTFTIQPCDLADVTIEDIEDLIYVPGGLMPEPAITYNEMPLVAGTDFTVAYSDNENVGAATVTITGVGNYTGEQVRQFNILKSKAQIIFEPENYEKHYGDEPFKINATVIGDGKYIFHSSFVNVLNVDKNTGEVTIVGTGRATVFVTLEEGRNYYGTAAMCQVVVLPKDGETLTAEQKAGETLTDEDGKAPTLIVKDGDKVLVEGENYDVTYRDSEGNDLEKWPTAAGDYVAVVTLKGLYTGEKTVAYTIAKGNKTLFREYRTEQMEVAEGLAEEGDSEACLQLIADAKTTINRLKFNPEKTMAQNKAIVDAIIEQLKADLAAQRLSDGIRSIENGKMDNGQWYDLSGRRVAKPTKGIYIHNGRRVVVK